jgi:hypothetical protein
MKISMLLPSMMVPWLVLAANIHAQTTDDMFYAEEPEANNYPNLFGITREEHDERLRKEAIKAGECRPAELDTEGHWGQVVAGYQSSIRSKTNVFVVGNSIQLSTIFRNTTTNTLALLNATKGMESNFVVEDEAGHIVACDYHKFAPGGSLYGFRPFAPRHQVKIEYDLNTQFSLKPGTYKIRSERRVFGPSATNNVITNYADLSSGVLVIKVVSP